jgi:integrase
MTREVHELLTEHMAGRPFWSANDLLLPFWDGDEANLPDVTNRLSKRFKTLFEYAGCVDLTEHDLRHEATCRWFELRSPDGSWMFRQEEISKIMGWVPGSSMAERYASFRVEDMAARLWANVA